MAYIYSQTRVAVFYISLMETRVVLSARKLLIALPGCVEQPLTQLRFKGW